MPIIKPFRAVRYDSTKVELNAVVAPPYDVISPEQQSELYERSPHNVVRLILGREEDRYTSAAKSYHSWFRDGILVQDAEPAIYCVVHTFSTDGNENQRKGVILRCKLEEFEKRIVLPHERTMSKPKDDRLKLLELTKANFNQIFSFYLDTENSVDEVLERHLRRDPVLQVSFEGMENSIWSITEPSAVQAVAAHFQDKQVFIADGHHRYESCLNYRDIQKHRNPRHTGEESYNYIMMYLTNMDDPGLVILPTHRLVHGLEEFNLESFLQELSVEFEYKKIEGLQRLRQGLAEARQHAFGMIATGDGGFYLIRLKRDELARRDLAARDRATPEVLAGLDVTLLHGAVFEKMLHISPDAQVNQTNLRYVRDAEEVVTAVRAGEAQLGFLMNPTKIEQVRAVSAAGEILPQKSTYFYPKLLSGLLINRLDE